MTIGLLLSALFVILQLAGTIDWQWWQLVLPAFIEIGLGIIWAVFWFGLVVKISR